MTPASRHSEQPPAEPSTVRLFFALWPDADAVRALSEWQARAYALCGGRPMRLDTLHITLAFLGNVPSHLAQALAEHAAVQRVAPGVLTLDRYGAFPRQRIVWTGPGEEDTAKLGSEVSRLWDGIAHMVPMQPEHTYRPHVTLLRNADPVSLPEPLAPIAWRYDRHVLVQSSMDGQSRYQVLATSRG